MVTQKELFTQKGRVETLEEKKKNAKERSDKIEKVLEDIYKKPEMQFDQNTQTVYGIKFFEYIVRVKDYIDELEILNEAHKKYSEMLEELFSDFFPDMEFEMK